jgi:hypothetical protein
MQGRVSIALVAVAVAVAGGAGIPTPASATHKSKNCGLISVGKHDYRVHAKKFRCAPARSASLKYLRQGKPLAGFDCAPTGGHSFYCQKPPKAYWAIRQ